ncbi:GNAT family N-acetyltransferase [Streptomyces decoyicus]|uniref:GNAT family N-acetyltransferase n=1 Tax=Streptomyces decoyicus TaxID=249567 RepID=UPI003C12BAF7
MHIVLINDGRIVGSARLARHDSHDVLETGVWLARSGRGRGRGHGIGLATLRKLLDEAASTGACAVVAETTANHDDLRQQFPRPPLPQKRAPRRACRVQLSGCMVHQVEVPLPGVRKQLLERRLFQPPAVRSRHADDPHRTASRRATGLPGPRPDPPDMPGRVVPKFRMVEGSCRTCTLR